MNLKERHNLSLNLNSKERRKQKFIIKSFVKWINFYCKRAVAMPLPPSLEKAQSQRPLKDRKMSIDGYSSNIFDGKPEQMTQVANFISSKGFLPFDLIENEVAWFYK